MILLHDDLLLSYNFVLLFFFTDTATTEIYTLSLHDALPIFNVQPLAGRQAAAVEVVLPERAPERAAAAAIRDRKSTRLNSSHQIISYAVFCLKKKKKDKRKLFGSHKS